MPTDLDSVRSLRASLTSERTRLVCDLAETGADAEHWPEMVRDLARTQTAIAAVDAVVAELAAEARRAAYAALGEVKRVRSPGIAPRRRSTYVFGDRE
ncbi:MAG: hypothetical protein GC191_11485 [Azospirillum sp.]|nr:hypothetical protein [Azospirillum sp.]